LNSPSYIAIEGPIGVGKTSFARLLASEMNARLVLENADENPFLREFYKDRAGRAFQTQLYFLLSRYRQQESEFSQFDLFGPKLVISDYIFSKDRIFASQNLEENELAVYDQVYSLLSPRVKKPDKVVYLQADDDTLMERIKRRDRDFERRISKDYISQINEAYNRFFFGYSDTPLLVVQTRDIDFVRDPSELRDLIRQVGRAGPGTLYYRPMPGTFG